MPIAAPPNETSNLVRFQQELTEGLLSWDALDRINIVQWRKLRLDSEIKQDTVWNTPRNGRSGCGVLVEMPIIEVPQSPAPGPTELFTIGLLAIEEPNLNFAPETGTQMDAESVARLLRKFVHQWFQADVGELYVAEIGTRPVEEFPGLVAYRTTASVLLIDDVFPRLNSPVLSEPNPLELRLENPAGQEDAEIYFTLDDTFPGLGNPIAQKWEGNNFSVESGTVIRYAAWQAGYLPSHVHRATIT